MKKTTRVVVSLLLIFALLSPVFVTCKQDSDEGAEIEHTGIRNADPGPTVTVVAAGGAPAGILGLITRREVLVTFVIALILAVIFAVTIGVLHSLGYLKFIE